MSRRNRPAIKSPCIADRYVTGPERIAEFYAPGAKAGGLISVREVQAGGADSRGLHVVVEVYRCDAPVYVRINGRDYKAAA